MVEQIDSLFAYVPWFMAITLGVVVLAGGAFEAHLWFRDRPGRRQAPYIR